VGWRSAGLSKSLFGPSSSESLLPPRAVPAVPPPAQEGCYTLRRLRNNPSATGVVRPGLPSQAISYCIRWQPRASAALWLERLLTNREASLCSSPTSSSPPQASAADHCQAWGNPATLLPTSPSKPSEMLLLFMKIGSGSCCHSSFLSCSITQLPELSCHRGSYRKAPGDGTPGTL